VQQFLSSPRPVLGEAHGGYTYCALAAWVMLKPFLPEDGPQISTKRLLHWAATMQGSEIENGGFRGRTNKLVDGCYSWWLGAEFSLLESLGATGYHFTAMPQGSATQNFEDEWDEADGMY
jgi:protein farnesyltransferase subunit beta